MFTTSLYARLEVLNKEELNEAALSSALAEIPPVTSAYLTRSLRRVFVLIKSPTRSIYEPRLNHVSISALAILVAT